MFTNGNKKLSECRLELKKKDMDPQPKQMSLNFNPEEIIVITHYVHPQHFSYITWQKLETGGASVNCVESQLFHHCQTAKQQELYKQNQHVIVRYKPQKTQKYLRGLVVICQNDEYSVWTLDYGFLLICRVEDLWPLPTNLSEKYMDMQWGGLADITPIGGSTWSTTAKRLLDKRLEEAQMLIYKTKDSGNKPHSFGQLLIKTPDLAEELLDASSYLVRKDCALSQLHKPEQNSELYYNIDLVEINDADMQPSTRVATIMKLMELQQTKENLPIKPNQDLASIQPTNSSAKNNNNKAKKSTRNGYHILGEKIRNLKCPSIQPERLEYLLQTRQAPEVPVSALQLSKINNANFGSVESALFYSCSSNSSSNSSSSSSSRDSSCSIKSLDASKVQVKPANGNSRNILNLYRRPMIEPEMSSNKDKIFNEKVKESEISFPSPLNKLTAKSVKKSTKERSKNNSVPAKVSENGFTKFVRSDKILLLNSAETDKASKAAQDPTLDFDKYKRIYNEYRATPATKSNFTQPKPGDNQLRMPSLLAHSFEPVLPMCELANSVLSQDICNAMRQRNIQTPLPTQRFAWPHLMRGNSLILFDRNASSRSWCYLPALCSLVMADMQSGANNVGPFALLLVDSVDNAQVLSANCNQLMATYETKLQKVINSHELSMDEVKLAMINSCGILVTTLPHLKQLLQLRKNLINPLRLKYCIFDDYDRMRLAAPDLFKQTLQLLPDIVLPKLQLIVIAQQWHPDIYSELVERYAHNPLLLFGDFLEATIYGNIKLNVVLGRSDQKTQLLLEYLASQQTLKKRLIFCKNELELAKLKESLKAAGYECKGHQDAANQKPYQLLLLTDAQLQHLHLARNFELVLHYSLPDSWTKFSYRFHVFCDNIRNHLKPLQTHRSIISYIMLDESNSFELPRLMQFLDAHNIKLDQTIRNIVASCRWQTDQRRQFCASMLSTGNCELTYCSKRHFVISRDVQHSNSELWQPGTLVRCQLVDMLSPVHMSCMATSFNSNGSWQNTAPLSAVRCLGTALKIHMSELKNQRRPAKLELYDICVLYHSKQYQRVRIVDFIDEQKAMVRLIDEGTRVLKVKQTELLECADKFKEQPATILDVRLCGLLPNADDIVWQPSITKLIKPLLSNLIDNQYLQFVVEFCMFNVVYVKNITVMQECPTLKTCVKVIQLHTELVSQGYARPDEQSLEKLRNIYSDMTKQRTQATKTKLENELTAASSQPELERLDEAKHLTEVVDVKEQTRESFAEQATNGKSNEFDNVENNLFNNESFKPKNTDSLSQEQNTIIEIATSANQSFEQTQPTEALQSDNEQHSADMLSSMLLQGLCSDTPNVKDAALNMLQDILGENSKVSPSFNKPSTKSKEIQLNAIPEKSQVAQELVASALSCGTVADKAVRPKVKWHQTLTHIELIFQQEVPEYQLLQHGNVVIYQASEAIPPQRCILNLLGEVKILSERQHGYQLHVKLAKHGLHMFWPTLLSSLHAQQSNHWLVYDTQRGESSGLPKDRRSWFDYESRSYRQAQVYEESNSSTDELSDWSD